MYILDCFAPSVKLIPSQSSLQSRIQYRKSQEFSISSIIMLNCSNSSSITTKWMIKNCSSFNCTSQININENLIKTTLSELYIPSKILPYGIYEFMLTVSMTNLSQLKSFASTYIEIISSDILINFNEYQSTMIKFGYQQNLIFNPGKYSINPDDEIFDASRWIYTYYCRIFDQYNFPMLSGLLLTIDDRRIDPMNVPCLSNHTIEKLIFGNLTTSPNSSLIIPANSLQINRTYEFLIKLTNRLNPSIEFRSSLIVKIEQVNLPLIAIG